MCILQDFEALTPNLLARTIETVEGGGIVVILLKTMSSLKQLYTMTMDIHSRYRTEAHDDVVARFNERFILSLGSCESCLVVDDELNVLPISGAKTVKPLPPADDDEDEAANLSKEAKELRNLKESLQDVQPVGSLVNVAKTVDQAKAITTFVEALGEKSLRGTVTLTAGRGRGKSAAMGLAVAAAVSHGYSNIFITSPSPENLKTLFEFIFKGFDALGYDEHMDYDILQSTDPEFNKAIVRVNIFRSHRQTIQYIRPQDASVLGQAELVVIDEAAAIPLPLVKKLLGPYLVFMASTINGYEGTGRSLSLKLIQQLREQSRMVTPKKENLEGQSTVVDRSGKQSSKFNFSGGLGSRTLREIELNEPIRYAPGDAVEKWLNKLLCLEATLPPSISSSGLKKRFPHPNECQLYCVNRDTLFSFHPVSEAFLHRMMALYVASHYKNTPNDLQLLSDAPAHQLYVLLPPTDESDHRLPEPLCVIQLALEGEISKQSIMNNLNRGQRAGGDLIPWIVSQQFQDSEFGTLSGARVVRIATHPEYTKMGYGSRSMELLTEYFQGKYAPLVDPAEGITAREKSIPTVSDMQLESGSSEQLLTETIKVRDSKSMPPLLLKLSEQPPSKLDYMGVSYGLTPQLLKFWKKGGYKPVYLRQTPNELTGEHTCVMIKTLSAGDDSEWLDAFTADFRKRFIQLLAFEFRDFASVTGLSILEAALVNQKGYVTKQEIDSLFSPYDLKRLESYANKLLDYHVIVDLLPAIAQLYMQNKLRAVISEIEEEVKLSAVQATILLGIGLQKKDVTAIEKELSLPSSQILAMFAKSVRKIATFFRGVQERAVEASMFSSSSRVKTEMGDDVVAPAEEDEMVDDEEIINGDLVSGFTPMTQRLADDLADAGAEVLDELKEKQKELINALDLTQYAIDTDPAEWDISDRLAGRIAKDGKGVVSIKSNKDKKRKGDASTASEIFDEELKKMEKAKMNGGGHKRGSKKSRKF